eukprot:8101216-Prorocentrum_lima.AAC.1
MCIRDRNKTTRLFPRLPEVLGQLCAQRSFLESVLLPDRDPAVTSERSGRIDRHRESTAQA